MPKKNAKKPPPPPLPPVALRRWLKCRQCKISKFRRHAVVGEGRLPAEILMIGEGPGKTEDLWGLPFKGRAGNVLKYGIRDATHMAGMVEPPSIYITNLVACRPTNKLNGPNRPPTPEESWTCWGRLEKILKMCKPKRVFLLGKVPQKHCKESCPGALHLVHPAYLLRLGGIECPEYRLFCRRMADAFREIRGVRTAIGLFPRRR